MTNPLERQRAGSYPETFTLAVLPGDIDPFACVHADDVCQCAHDWRIHWGNKPKVSRRRNVFVTDSP